MVDVIIAGAGLSGLATAWFLQKEGVDVLLLEARERSGGRIYTSLASGNNTPVEMGATWFNDSHTSFIRLLKELELPFYRQFQQGISVFDLYPNPPHLFDMADNGEASFRVAGGTSTLISTLVKAIGKDRIQLNSSICGITEKEEHVEVKTAEGGRFACKQLVLTLPPFLMIAQNIKFTPELPGIVTSVMEKTHTWMGEAIKFALEYRNPFWREKGYSGTVVSQTGMASEVYDHCNDEMNRFALKGFLSAAAADLPKEEREAMVVRQLSNVLGKEVGTYLSYTEKVWRNDKHTFAPYAEQLLPHQHNGHPVYRQPLMKGKLFLAGSETSSRFGGYMEGAVHSGFTTAKHILNHKAIS